jgi:hypothetical protein
MKFEVYINGELHVEAEHSDKFAAHFNMSRLGTTSS